MAENKGKPSGPVARDKKDVGKQGDIKNIGSIAGAKKKNLSRSAGIVAVTGGHPAKRPKEAVH
jgi:hypothetical protein